MRTALTTALLVVLAVGCSGADPTVPAPTGAPPATSPADAEPTTEEPTATATTAEEPTAADTAAGGGDATASGAALDAALPALPGDVARIGFTDWAAIRSSLPEAALVALDDGDVSAFVRAVYERSLPHTSLVAVSTAFLVEAGVDLRELLWEIEADREEGSPVRVLRFEGRASAQALRAFLEERGWTPEEGAGAPGGTRLVPPDDAGLSAEELRYGYVDVADDELSIVVRGMDPDGAPVDEGVAEALRLAVGALGPVEGWLASAGCHARPPDSFLPDQDQPADEGAEPAPLAGVDDLAPLDAVAFGSRPGGTGAPAEGSVVFVYAEGADVAADAAARYDVLRASHADDGAPFTEAVFDPDEPVVGERTAVLAGPVPGPTPRELLQVAQSREALFATC